MNMKLVLWHDGQYIPQCYIRCAPCDDYIFFTKHDIKRETENGKTVYYAYCSRCGRKYDVTHYYNTLQK
ncbi:MAG: hypothetical protein J1F33_07450 [Clostridiales bacterium]|nr:hypothetical protein [Clostridiales bacterium]